MATYKITSDNFTLGQRDTTIDGDALDGYNVDALIEGGHLTNVSTKSVKTETPQTPQELDK
jgi:hypothetical protein